MNSFGQLFRISIFGTSHGQEIGILVDGCPVGIKLSENDFLEDINRRKNLATYNTPRSETDKITISSGLYRGYTDGSPLLLTFKNDNYNDSEYNFIKEGFFRPGHADFTASKKYKSFNNPNGGGMFSGRMTLALVAAAVVAKKIIKDISIVSSIADFWVFADSERKIYNTIDEAKLLAEKLKTSIGGKVFIKINNIPIGLGEPFFDSVESKLSHAIFSIPGAHSIEFDIPKDINSNSIINEEGQLKTASFGINGGITNGNPINFSVGFKAAASISAKQECYNFNTKKIESFTLNGRHDLCYVNRAAVVVEAMSAIVLSDLLLIHNSQK